MSLKSGIVILTEIRSAIIFGYHSFRFNDSLAAYVDRKFIRALLEYITFQAIALIQILL